VRGSAQPRTDAIAARLTDTDAPPDLAQRVAELPAGRRFASPHDVMEALGINSPETNRQGQAGAGTDNSKKRAAPQQARPDFR
jgi:hypothetical protein